MSDSCDPVRLRCPWDSPGKNAGVCCHFLRHQCPLPQNERAFPVRAGEICQENLKTNSERQGVKQPMAVKPALGFSQRFSLFLSSAPPGHQQQGNLRGATKSLTLNAQGHCSLDGKESACSVGDLGSIPGSRRSSEGNGYSPTPVFLPGIFHRQRSRGCKESDTTQQLTHT